MEPKTPQFSTQGTNTSPSPKKLMSMLVHTPPRNAGIQMSPMRNLNSVAASRQVLRSPQAFIATGTSASPNVSPITTTAPVSILRDLPPLLPSSPSTNVSPITTTAPVSILRDIPPLLPSNPSTNVSPITTVATPQPAANSPKSIRFDHVSRPSTRASGTVPKTSILKNTGSSLALNTSASARASNSYAAHSRQMHIMRNQQQQITDMQKQMIEMQQHLVNLNNLWKSNEKSRVDVEYLKAKVSAISGTTYKEMLENFQQELQTPIDYLKEAYDLIPHLQLVLESAISALDELVKREA